MKKADFIHEAENYAKIDDVTSILWQREIVTMEWRSKRAEKVLYFRQRV